MEIRGIDNKIYKTECMGCDIAGHRLQPFGGIIFEDDDFVVCQDFEVPIDGFIIISTKQHVSSINDMSDKQKQQLILLLDHCLKLLKELGVAKEFIMVQGERSDVHFHISLMPRKQWMEEKFGRIIANLKAIQDYAKQNMKTEQNLRQILATTERLKENFNKK